VLKGAGLHTFLIDDLFIRFCLQNNGRLSSRKRESHFGFLSDEEVSRTEDAVQDSYGGAERIEGSGDQQIDSGQVTPLGPSAGVANSQSKRRL
jgi:hypothetical protein